MKSFNTKLVLFSLGIVAMLASPAFAQKQHHVTGANLSAVYGASQSAGYSEIPGYDRDGGVVGVPNPDQR